MNCKALAVRKSGRTLKTLLTAIVVFASMITGMAQVPSYVPSNGLVGWWPFNGNANDESGNGNNGTVNGATLTADRNGNANAAYSFDGVNDYIQSINPLGNLTSDFTISLYTNIATWQGGLFCHVGIDQNSNPRDGFGIGYGGSQAVNSGQNLLSLLSNIAWYQSGYQFSALNNWQHVVVTRSANLLTYYVQGVAVGNTTIVAIQPPSNALFFGSGAIAYANFNGSLDDIGIWNRALTQQEIANLYTASTPPPCNPLAANLQNGLVGYWPFCGNANDESGNGNNGTVNGATLTNDRFGNANAAYSFDGVNDFIEVQHSSSFQFVNEETVSYWIDYDLLSTYPYRYITKKGLAGQNGQFYSRLDPNNHISHLLFDGNNYNSLVSSNPISNNSWINIIHSYNGSKIKTYINGILTDSIQAIFPLANNISSLFFGADGNSQGFYSGKIDDICIWNRALTQNEITQLYTGSPCVNYQVITVTDTLIINANLTGVNPVTFQNAIKVYPNPSSTQITIDFGANFNTLAGYTMRIQNAVGQTVYTTGVTQQQFTSNLSTWTGNGIYFVYLIDAQGNTVDVKKIILQ